MNERGIRRTLGLVGRATAHPSEPAIHTSTTMNTGRQRSDLSVAAQACA